MVLLNKVDLISSEQLETVHAIIRSLNAKAKVITTQHAKVDYHEVINTGLFDLEEAQNHPLWVQELYHFKDHVPETEEYGITSFVYRARAPFDPAKIHAFAEEWPGVIRAKGFFWLATRPDFVGELSQAGAFVRHHGLGKWWVVVPKEDWPEGDEFDHMVKQQWDEHYGDRRQEIVFIGMKSDMQQENLSKRLDACLISDFLESSERYSMLPDPFPKWFEEE